MKTKYLLILLVLFGGRIKAQEAMFNNGAAIYIAGGAVLQVNGNISLSGGSTTNGGTVTLTGNFNSYNNATTDFSNGTLICAGTLAQQFNGIIPVNNFTVNNPAGVSLNSGMLTVYGLYTPTAGQLTSNGHLTLASTAEGTATVANAGSNTNYVTGTVTVERYIPNTIVVGGNTTQRRAWRLLTAPLSQTGTIFDNWQNGGTADSSTGAELFSPTGTGPGGNGFTKAGTAAAISTYNSPTDTWTDLVNTTGTSLGNNNGSAANNAFAVFITGPYGSNHIKSGAQPTTLKATGLLQTGTQTFSYSGIDNGKYLLIGNPYASAIDFATIQKNNVANTVWLWDAQRAGTSLGGYVSYSYDEATHSYDLDVPATDTRQTTVIQSGQAFFVQSLGTSLPAGVTIQESDKVDNSQNTNDVFFGPAGSSTVPQLRITLNKAGQSVDGVLVKLGDVYSNTISDDAAKLFNYDENLSIKKDNSYISIERMPVPKEGDSLWLDVYAMKGKTGYSFTMAPQDLPISLKAYLLDRYLTTKPPLDISITNTINFTTSTDSASYAEDRFVVVFAKAGALASTVTSVKAWQQSKDVQVQWQTASEHDMRQYIVEKSADGQNFTTMQYGITPLNSGRTEAYTITDNQPIAGGNYYRIKLVNNDGSVRYSNVVKVSFTKGKAAMAVYPNPAPRMQQLRIGMENMEAGKYTIQLFSSDGKHVVQKAVQYDGAAATQAINLPPSIAAGSYSLILLDDKGNKWKQQVIVE